MEHHAYVLTGGHILTLDKAAPLARAVAVENGIIRHLGSEEELLPLINQGWTEIPLQGRTVLPGFIDAHGHMMMTGLKLTGIDLARCRSLDEVLALCASAAQDLEKGAWIRGYSLNDQDLAEKTMPLRADLDRVSQTHPICLMHATLHMATLNTLGLKKLGFPPDLPGLDLAAGSGRPTGVIRDPGIISHLLPSLNRQIPEPTKLAALKAAACQALDQGITTLHALDGGDFGPNDTAMIWNNRQDLPIGLVCFNQSMDLSLVKALGLDRVGGCICADGAFEAHTAALFEPYADEPHNYGDLTYSQETMDGFILSAHSQGYQIAVHCESERSIEQVLRAMEKALEAFPRQDHRHRIEHLELPTFNQLERMARAGIVASMQPAFIPAFIGQDRMELYERLLGKQRLCRVHPYQRILDLGIPLCGGSDSPVTPYGPLAGIQAAVRHPNPDQALAIGQALEMFTTTAAFSGFEEKEKGTITPGKNADLVILDENPLEVPKDRIARIPVHATLVKGRSAHPQRLDTSGQNRATPVSAAT